MEIDQEQICYDVPAITSTLPWRINPHYDQQLEQNLYDWLLAEFRDYPHVEAWWPHIRNSQLALWGPLALPGIDRNRLEAWNRQIMTWVMVDDINERRMPRDRRNANERNAPWQALLQAIQIMQVHPDPAGALQDQQFPIGVSTMAQATWDVARLMSPLSRTAYLEASADTLHSFVREERGFDRADTATHTDLDTYLTWRDASYAMRIYFADVQDRTPAPLTPEELGDPRLERIRRAVSLHAALANDVYSFRKEVVYRRDHLSSQLNVITILAFHDGLAWQQAVDEGVAMVGRKEQEYIALRDAWFAQGASAAVRAYCAGLEEILAGNLRFLLINPRYHGDGFTGEFRGGRVSCRPDDRALF